MSRLTFFLKAASKWVPAFAGMTAIVFFSISIYAADPSLNTLLSHMRTLQADFTQITSDARGKQTQKSEGSFALQRPNQFRWEVKKPIPQLIVTDGKRLSVYDPDLEQVTIRPLDKQVSNTPVLLLMNNPNALNQAFNVQSMKRPDNLQWFSLTPRHTDSMLSVVELGFSRGVISEMRLQDQLGHHIVIQFSSASINLNLSPALFRFSPPKGVDIIH